ncbi:MAG TPA: hypothetical protein VKQ30_20245 [Ktedonobacterales bacterium]|nr:hypothetical protein [Ktedonobacterales bacterium]
MPMGKTRTILLIALIVFVISFLLPAIWLPNATPRTLQGYWCAYNTLVSPWTADGLKDLPREPVQYFSVLLSGWINPLFLITLFLLYRGKKLGGALRIAVLCLMPACWVVFVQDGVYPFIGYFLWTAAIIVALFSSAWSSLERDRQIQAAAA